MKLNTRLHDRIRFKTWVKVILKSGPGMLGHIEDISTSGLGIEHDKPIEAGGACNIYFMLPYAGREHIVQARCRIASCRPAEAAGRFIIGLAFVEFVSDPRTTAELIESFVQQLETGQ
ncbi:PilZ domain-containing protein [Chitinimonas sp.]|uniref:PilZ domain-containing protein n=1 Tax=Chitinimonas sp. TaxID=1934313 RepID=UPI0035B19EC5